MSTENFEGIDKGAIREQLGDLYRIVEEIAVLKAMLDELGAGGRNTNDVYAIKAVADWLRETKIERAAIRRIIHEMPFIRTDVHSQKKTLGTNVTERGGSEES